MLRTALALFVTLGFATGLRAQSEDFGRWIALFDGKDLDGWQTAKPRQAGGKNLWKVEDGTLTNGRSGANDIATTEEFEDYELELEYRIPGGGNSGVYLRGQIEVQIADSHRKKESGKPLREGDAGGIYGRAAPLRNVQKPAGEWNNYRILHIGNRITVWHNSELIQDNVYVEKGTGGAMGRHNGRKLEIDKGPLMLQGDHSEVWYRNIRIRPLLGKGWKAIWNGEEDLSAVFTARGDRRAEDGLRWEVRDHAFTNTHTGGQGHDLWTKEPYGNFLVYYAYRSDLRPEDDEGRKIRDRSGNSGFYLRDQWEIQILKEQSTTNAHTDGSLYSKKPPAVHARHGAEEWNHMFVKVEGMKITAWQNGKLIHDGVTLDTRTDNHGVKTERFTRAPFKLQGDHGKVWLSAIHIKPLPDTEA